MTLIQQLHIALVQAPLSIGKMKRLSLKWATIYLFVGVSIFGLLSWYLVVHQVAIRDLLLDYLFPQSWHDISIKLADFLFESQTKSVVANMILSGSLVFSSIFLFPIKEQYSAIFEQEAKLNNKIVIEFPLVFQALEEMKLFLFYLTAQSVILWIGYYPYVWTTWLSISLSYLFLFFTFGLDIISPTLQRHRTKYSIILKIAKKKYLVFFCFGILFSLPMIWLSQWILKLDDISLIEGASYLFIANIVILTLAIPAGTKIGSEFLPIKSLIVAPTRKAIRWGYALMALLLTCTLYLHSQLVISLHHKSQLLKANYSIDWSSIEYNLPSFSQLTSGKAFSNLSFDIEIHNSTEFDIEVEKSQLYLQRKEERIAVIDVSGFKLASGKQKKIKITLDSNSDLSHIKQLEGILDGWRVDIHLDVWPGIPLVLNILESE